jgi:hypothetical protein
VNTEQVAPLAQLIVVVVGLLVMLRLVRLGTAMLLILGAGLLPGLLPSALHVSSQLPLDGSAPSSPISDRR